MKIFYFMSNILMFLLMIILAYLNFSFVPAPSDPLLERTPSIPDFSETVKNKFTFKSSIVKEVSAITEDNLFSPFRAKEEGEIFPSLKVTGLELVGVFKYGDEAGALIIEKSGGASITPGGRSPGVTRSVQVSQADQPVFYRINDILPNGFLLKEVNPDSVLLVRGKEQIILQIDFEDEGTSRRGTAGSTATKNETIIIQSQLGQQKATISAPKQSSASRTESSSDSVTPPAKESEANQTEPDVR